RSAADGRVALGGARVRAEPATLVVRRPSQSFWLISEDPGVDAMRLLLTVKRRVPERRRDCTLTVAAISHPGSACAHRHDTCPRRIARSWCRLRRRAGAGDPDTSCSLRPGTCRTRNRD